ncbi:sulfotransferase [Mesorhizobium sp. ZMM04-5]|uniref:Sulfotransferase n=1 Tax=Mesorhizobium marinum TaxID=3228790 RepID=A0ABV3R050_9HYPH
MSRLPASFAKHLKPVRRPATPPPVAKKTVNGVDELLRRAKEFHDKGDFTEAEKHCVMVLARDPGNAQALLLAGSLARGVDDLGLALIFFRKALARQPKSVETHLVLAATYSEAHEHDNAIKHFREALSLQPGKPAALGGLGQAYTAAGKAELALPQFEEALRSMPEHPSLRLDHANALIALGRMEEAADLLRENIALGHRVAASYRTLADTRKFSTEPAELKAILEKLEENGLPPKESVSLHHAAGKILNDLGKYDSAIDHFQESKIVSGHGFDLDAFRRKIDSLVAGFTPQLLKSKAGYGNPSEAPVFIVGMPRSGTTLTEQICASHPAVHGAGELSKLGTVVRTGGYNQAPDGSIKKTLQSITRDEARSMAREYLDFIRGTAPSAARIVDKMPHNFQHVGMIALLFPNAKIIHCTRDPIDNCVSCFFNTFNENHGYNTDLHTLGLYYREYRRLMQHWNTLLPGRIFEANYETMIADQEAETRRLIEFLGLPWDDACLRFYETDRSVTTPSRWQVRQPIYRSSVKRWKKYEHKIQPLIESLGDLADV